MGKNVHLSATRPTKQSVMWRVVTSGLVFVCLFFSLVLPACVRQVEVDVDGENFAGPEMGNLRFEVGDQLDLTPKDTLWLKDGEQFVIRWDTATLSSFQGSTCELCTENNPQANPNNIMSCILSNGERPVFAFGIYVDGNGNCIFTRADGSCASIGDPVLLEYKNFMKGAEPVKSFFFPVKGCGSSPPIITPAENATYEFVPAEMATKIREPKDRPPLLSKKIFVIKKDLPQKTSYRLARHTEVDPHRVWYSLQAQSDAIRQDGFSKNLRVGRVRILKGLPKTDPLTGGLTLSEESVAPVRPSRILPILNFDSSRSVRNQDGNRCYADLSADGDIDLSDCRPAFANNAGMLLITTPTFMPPTTVGELPVPISWFVEFNLCEGCGDMCNVSACGTGAAFPVLGAGEVLAIEFTIQGI